MMYTRILKMASKKSLFTDIFPTELAKTKLNRYIPYLEFYLGTVASLDKSVISI